MSLSPLPLGYCTNVHPGRSLAEVEAGLDCYTVPVMQRLSAQVAAGLWLAQPVVWALLTGDELARFADRLTARGLVCYTLNAFPYGNFHDVRVKEKVYVPDWADPRRLSYTRQCAEALAGLLPSGIEGSISTLPLGFKSHAASTHFMDAAIHNLIACASFLSRLRETTGKVIRLAIEPEPLCVIETTGEAIGFFRELWEKVQGQHALQSVREHVGLCYDVCHQAVEFEEIVDSIAALHAAGIRINKVHVSCALQIDHPAENEAARQALRQYIEPRYLHQTLARLADGSIARYVDLDETLISATPAQFQRAACWRVHFHVPVNASRLGPLLTTRPQLEQALRAVAALPYAPHLEVETYTWEVMPGARDLVGGLTGELQSTRQLLQKVSAPSPVR